MYILIFTKCTKTLATRNNMIQTDIKHYYKDYLQDIHKLLLDF